MDTVRTLLVTRIVTSPNPKAALTIATRPEAG